jgi:hypothetical protein
MKSETWTDDPFYRERKVLCQPSRSDAIRYLPCPEPFHLLLFVLAMLFVACGLLKR